MFSPAYTVMAQSNKVLMWEWEWGESEVLMWLQAQPTCHTLNMLRENTDHAYSIPASMSISHSGNSYIRADVAYTTHSFIVV